jgi:hypothetical protein
MSQKRDQRDKSESQMGSRVVVQRLIKFGRRFKAGPGESVTNLGNYVLQFSICVCT